MIWSWKKKRKRWLKKKSSKGGGKTYKSRIKQTNSFILPTLGRFIKMITVEIYTPRIGSVRLGYNDQMGPRDISVVFKIGQGRGDLQRIWKEMLD